MKYDLTKQEMLELLSDIVQSSSVTGPAEQDLLNFLSDLRDQQPMTFLEKLLQEHPEIEIDLTIKAYTACPCAFKYEDYNPVEVCDVMSCVECWLRKTV
ncbi:hypothetical protein GH808_09025 [Acetobacterium fimetarium]|uniref:Uncharacterized protein n=1 Tax=Acetobacterium fimetarium TaxID=52691 RepID=A0ABR6WWF0_9FIRM|nr:hypothetical protein [Acetobacterium fimetarium]MBC3804571.1 hypothetical protein [Acetobacterium fimetarium]